MQSAPLVDLDKLPLFKAFYEVTNSPEEITSFGAKYLDECILCAQNLIEDSGIANEDNRELIEPFAWLVFFGGVVTGIKLTESENYTQRNEEYVSTTP